MTRLRDEGKVSEEEEEARELSPRMMAGEQALWELEKKAGWMAGPPVMGRFLAGQELRLTAAGRHQGLGRWSFLGAAGGWGWGWGGCGMRGRWTSAG